MVRPSAVVLLLAAAVAAAAAASGPAERRVLVFHKHNGVGHGATDTCIARLKAHLAAHGIAAESTRDSLALSPGNLAGYGAVVFFNTNYRGGRILARAQEAAVEAFVQAGGGFVGLHNATPLTGSPAIDSVWPWYVRLWGTRFVGHPNAEEGDVVLEDSTHASTRGLPRRLTLRDEWYLLRDDPRLVPGVTVHARVDAATLSSGGKDRVLTWSRAFEGGRAWFTTLGHDLGTFGNAHFLSHVRGGIVYAGGWDGATSARREPLLPKGPASAAAGIPRLLYRLPGETTWRTLSGRARAIPAALPITAEP